MERATVFKSRMIGLQKAGVFTSANERFVRLFGARKCVWDWKFGQLLKRLNCGNNVEIFFKIAFLILIFWSGNSLDCLFDFAVPGFLPR